MEANMFGEIKHFFGCLFCRHDWEEIERGTCDYIEGKFGWGYQRYWIDRCKKCGQIVRHQTHWPIDVDTP